MPQPKRDRQPQDVSEIVTNYLEMTRPRDRQSRPRRRSRPERGAPTRERESPSVDDDVLPLVGGNDLA
jgi:hypothetical protein